MLRLLAVALLLAVVCAQSPSASSPNSSPGTDSFPNIRSSVRIETSLQQSPTSPDIQFITSLPTSRASTQSRTTITSDEVGPLVGNSYYSRPSTPPEAPASVLLGSFQGSYTSDSSFGQALHLCVDGKRVQGSYDEVGLLTGELDDDEDTLTGEWVQAGTGACTSGSFTFQLTSVGFSGFFTCEGDNEQFLWEERKLSNFRPSDDRCALLDLDDDDGMSGRWVDKFGNPTDICVFGGAGEASYLREQDGDETAEPKREGYVEGRAHQRAKVVAGTWYEELVGGSVLFYLRNNGDLHSLWWTGLRGVRGDTVIDPSQLRDETRHFHRTLTGPLFAPSVADCGRFSVLKQFVLVNAPKTDDDDGIYYFVGSDYFDSEFPFYNYPDSSSDASSLAVTSLLAMALAIVL